MVNHPNRNAATIETMRSHLVSVTKKIRPGEFSKISKINGERLVLEAHWLSRQIYVTVARGGHGPTKAAENFNVDFLFSPDRTVEEVIGFSNGDVPKANFAKMYQEFVIARAREAQEILESAPVDKGVSDEIKSRVRAVLDPFADARLTDQSTQL